MNDFEYARSLIKYLQWIQRDTAALVVAQVTGVTPLSSIDYYWRIIYPALMNVTSQGVPVHPDYNCYSYQTNVLCSNNGECVNGACVCNKGKTGTQCDQDVIDASSSDDTLLIALTASLIPAFALLLLICIVIIIIVLVRRRKKKEEAWEIDFNELALGETLGMGAFGEVYKATWKGTEVSDIVH